ncbi:EAL domain-containing protein [Parasphingopyxis algicola]|uniref:putative bifunctional diguanylate cyclase/phosphodiesterase n=1 Tax=Parasphingopyxis algicola TaxID=2026624 RepID=UPI0015A484CF|nr:EAL domain-containing protein [Parasphingopyxis algicola]QLC24638.1 EAL domain-containing protein [Parasphingopyxis algicola]
MDLMAEKWDKQTHRCALTQAYLPILRGFFCVAAAYYAVMTVAHFVTRSGTELVWFSAISITTVIAALIGVYLLARSRSPAQVDVIVLFINLLVLSNVLIALQLDFNRTKLVYFIVMAMIFAFSGTSLRQTIPSIVVAIVCLFAQIFQYAPELAGLYGFIAFASSVSSIAISASLRKSIALALAERREAERGRASAELLAESARAESHTDSLTGLPNRRAFVETLENRIQTPRAGRDPLWLVVMDLDGFKPVNDVYGHRIGDELLCEVARRLRRHCSGEAFAARVGGDEFSILRTGSGDLQEMQLWCDQLIADLARPFEIEGKRIHISASAGCEIASADDTSAALLENADYALLHAKRNSKGSAVVFDACHAQAMEEQFQIGQVMSSDGFESELEVLFQPQVELSSNRIVGAEALLRWTSPTLGQVSPAKLIAVAEDAGTVSRITLIALEKTLEVAAHIPESVSLAVNLSAMDLRSDQSMRKIIDLVRASRCRPERLEFEVTETVAIDTHVALRNFERLAQAGHRIALDDFGSGYANFSLLQLLPIHSLKLDKSLIERPSDPVGRELARAVIAMARVLRIDSIVEGIETPYQLALAHALGATRGQGFLLGKPMKAHDFEALLAKQTDSPTESMRRSA